MPPPGARRAAVEPTTFSSRSSTCAWALLLRVVVAASLCQRCSAGAGGKHAFELGEDVVQSPLEPAVMLMGVLAVSVCIEKITEVIEHRASKQSIRIVQRVYKEVMIMGTMSFILVVVILQVEPEGFSIPLFEFCHFLLFFMSIFFSLGCIFTILWVRRQERSWRDTERAEHALHAWRHQGHELDVAFSALQGTWRLPDGTTRVVLQESVTGSDGRWELQLVAHQVWLGDDKLKSCTRHRLTWDIHRPDLSTAEVEWQRQGPAPAPAHELLSTDAQQMLLKLALAFRRDKEMILKNDWFQKHVGIRHIETTDAQVHVDELQPPPPGMEVRSIGELRRDIAQMGVTGGGVFDYLHRRIGGWGRDEEGNHLVGAGAEARERKIAVLALSARIDRLQDECLKREQFETARRRREVPLRYSPQQLQARKAQACSPGLRSSSSATAGMRAKDGLVNMRSPPRSRGPTTSNLPSSLSVVAVDATSEESSDGPFSHELHSHRYHPLEAGQQYEELSCAWDLLETLAGPMIENHLAIHCDGSSRMDDGSSSGSSGDSVHLVPLERSGRHHSTNRAAIAAQPDFGDEELRCLHVDAEHFEHAKVPFSMYRSRCHNLVIEEFLDIRWQTWLMMLMGTGFHILRVKVWEADNRELPRDGADFWIFGIGYALLGCNMLMMLKLQGQFASYYASMMQSEELERAKLWLGLTVPGDREGNLRVFYAPVAKLAGWFLGVVDKRIGRLSEPIEDDGSDEPEDAIAKREHFVHHAFELLWSFKVDLILLQFFSISVCIHLAATILIYSPRLHDIYCGKNVQNFTWSGSGSGSGSGSFERYAECTLGPLWSTMINGSALVPAIICFFFCLPASLSALADLTKLGANIDIDLLLGLEFEMEEEFRSKLEKDRVTAIVNRLKPVLRPGYNAGPEVLSPPKMGSPVREATSYERNDSTTDFYSGMPRPRRSVAMQQAQDNIPPWRRSSLGYGAAESGMSPYTLPHRDPWGPQSSPVRPLVPGRRPNSPSLSPLRELQAPASSPTRSLSPPAGAARRISKVRVQPGGMAMADSVPSAGTDALVPAASPIVIGSPPASRFSKVRLHPGGATDILERAEPVVPAPSPIAIGNGPSSMIK